MHAWLWGDRREPDTRLIFHSQPLDVRTRQLQAKQAPALSNKPCLRSSKVAGKRKVDDLDNDTSIEADNLASRQSTESDITSASLPPGSTAHEVHWIVLSSTSEYFKRRVTTSVGPGVHSSVSDASISPFKYVFSEQLEADQVEAAASVLQAMYTQELAVWSGTEEGHVNHLLLMLQVADRWQSSTCIDLVSKALQQTDPAHLTNKQLRCIYNQPAGLQSSVMFAPILEIARLRLLATHGDASAVARSPSLQYELLKLPQVAMLALLQSAELCTDSENSVLLVLLQWLRLQHGMNAFPVVITEQHRQLVEALRCTRLTNSFMPVLTSALGSKWSRHLAKLVQYRSLDPPRRAGNSDFTSTLIPASWYKPPRPQSPLSDLPTRLHVTMSKECLLASLEVMEQPFLAGRTLPPSVSASVYSHGFNWTLKLGLCLTPSSKQELLLSAVMTCICAIPNQAAPSFAACKVGCITQRVPPLTPLHSTWRNGLLGSRPFIMPHLQASFPLRGMFLDKAKWEPFLVDGSVRLEAVISDIS